MKEAREREIHLLDYWRVLVKRRWVVLTSLLVLTSTVTLGSLLMRPLYTATTRLQIEENNPKVLPFQDVVSSLPNARNDFYQTQYGLIQSRRVAGDVIARLKLDRHPEFEVRTDAAPGSGLTPERAAEGRRITLFLKRLEVSPVRNSRLVDISYESHDPALAARIANRVAETYIDFNTAAQYNTTTRATTSLARQIANLQEEIDAQEEELQAYAREQGIIELNDKQNITLKNLNDLSDSYTRARATRIEKEARYAALRDADPGGLPEVMDSPLIRDLTAKGAELQRRHAQLSDKYMPEWPEMMRLQREIDSNRERVQAEKEALYRQALGVAAGAWRAARNEEEQLRVALEEQKRRSQEFSLKEIRYNNLKAEVTNKRSTLEALVKRQAETSSSAGMNELAAGNVRVVDVAEPPVRPSSPKIPQNILMSLLAGLALGVGLAFFFEYLDKSVKNPEELQLTSGVASLGIIPALRPEGAGLRLIRGGARPVAGPSIDLITHADSKSKVAEAFRELRTALLVSRAGGPPRSILIASAQPGEGKTSVAVNLAITLAQAGRLVLLVDADLRKPRIHKVFGLPNDQGLSSWLSGAGIPWLEPRATEVPRLSAVTSGPLPPNPADLLNSERFVQFQREVEEQGYDHVIYDSPPALAVADPAILAGRVESVILVVHAGMTSRDAVALSIARLRQVKAPLTGTVLNRVDAQQQAYYYGAMYGRYYGDERVTRNAGAGTARAAAPEVPLEILNDDRRDRTKRV